MLEIELKFPVDDFEPIRLWLRPRMAHYDVPVQQVDQYYHHPSRDFAKTDEAFRIRRVGTKAWITYKGPRVDAETKSRRELELPLAFDETKDGNLSAADSWHELVLALGFRPAGKVAKTRQSHRLVYERWNVEVALDTVDGLGQFVELETAAGPDDADPARWVLMGLAHDLRLPLNTSERRSYLELLELRRASGELQT